MGTSYRGILNFLGDCGNSRDLQTREMKLPETTYDFDLTEFQNIVAGILPFTDCNLTSRTKIIRLTYSATAPGTGVNLDVKAKIYMKDASNGKTLSVEIPGAVASMFEATDEGDRVKVADVATIVGLIGGNLGLTLVPLYGKKIQRT